MDPTEVITTIALYYGLASVIVAIPLICLLDIKTREIPNIIWVVMVIANLPILGILYTHGLTQAYMGISLAGMGIFCLLWSWKLIGGADAKFLCVIALIVPISPLTYIPFLIVFYDVLAVVAVSTPIVVALSNFWRGYRIGGNNPENSFRVSWRYMFFHYPGGVPYTIPISVAFIIAVLLGVII